MPEASFTPKNPGVVIDDFTGGMNSLLPPDRIRPNQYSWLINGVNRGGIIQTRPGLDCLASIGGVTAQGGTIFTPRNSRPMMLLAVDGLIYAGKLPFKTFVKVEGLKFSADAAIITFQNVSKSVTRHSDGSLELIQSKPMVVIQDGSTLAGVFDGLTGVHSREETPFFGIPIGLWMASIASRLWVFSKDTAKVSDLANPDTFSENTYIAERSNFQLPADVTGAVETTDEKALLVFTESTTTSFKANIRDRSKWGETEEFQKVILPNIGCVSGRSPVNQYGLTWWMSQEGFINLDAAFNAKQSSRLLTSDGEMMRSKRLLSPNLSTVCSTSFQNFLLCSVPAGGRYNEQTWVADQSPIEVTNGPGMAWASIWTGVRPVVWMKTQNSGDKRIYFLSFDATPKDDTHIHVWEAFKSSRQDNRGRIASQLETVTVKASDVHRFRYAELELVEILGLVELNVFVGADKGPWYLVQSTTLNAQVGSLGSPIQRRITKESILQSFKPQARTVKTQEFSAQDRGCSGVESINNPGMGKGFQLLIEWRGRLGVKEIKIISEPDPSADAGACIASEVNQTNILTDAGLSL